MKISEIIDQIIGMANSLDEESRYKEIFEMWAIDYNKLGRCKSCVCEHVDKQICESYKLLKLYDKIANSDNRSSKIILFEIIKRMDDVSVNYRKQKQNLVDGSHLNEIMNNSHNSRLTLNNELERIRISCHLDLLNNDIMHEYNVLLVGDEYDRPSYEYD